ncbi:retropepsin-like aspartic protease family protein [Methylogaea oryzae]|uniref:Aspartyl protease n=1 Tax=Methylogaea oryzae TaxID=1295382 RepID=A0A8D4VNC3_9GAMM|nr:TIGR02281 family clan AA aspartic protease [Methylogaea oryzae]BBL71058.1 hypothetical protein MoryE10_16640 [Methylogaea oryzae]
MGAKTLVGVWRGGDLGTLPRLPILAVAVCVFFSPSPPALAEVAANGGRIPSAEGAPAKSNCTSHRTTIQQSPKGGYWADGYINNTKVSLHIDTGANVVAVPLTVARAAGLAVGEMGHANTASDVITTYRTVIPALRVGNLMFRNVKAAINPKSPDDEVLFGMSALEAVSVHQEQGTMVLSTEVCGQSPSAVEGAAAVAPEPAVVLKRSVRECMGPNHVIDKKAMECMKSAR